MRYKYSDFIAQLDKLIEQIKEFKPDIIIAVARGGMTLGHFISQKLDIRELYCINSIHYEKDKKLDDVKVTNIPQLSSNNNILIVDDIIDSGDSMVEILNVLQNKYPNNRYKVATLFYKKDAKVLPDYTLHLATEWIEFFWDFD